jgi:hypothetical protein
MRRSRTYRPSGGGDGEVRAKAGPDMLRRHIPIRPCPSFLAAEIKIFERKFCFFELLSCKNYLKDNGNPP